MDHCPFCDLATTESDDLIVVRTPKVFVIPAIRQRLHNRGHMLVLPRAHVTRLIDAEPALLQELYSVAARVSMAVRQTFGATGATIFQNDDGPDQVLFHLHIHIVPRSAGDNFKIPDPTKTELSREERQHQAVVLRRTLNDKVP